MKQRMRFALPILALLAAVPHQTRAQHAATPPSADEPLILRITSNLASSEPDGNWAFHILTDDAYVLSCVIPCETRLQPGIHQFGFSQGTQVRPLPELVLDSDATLHIEAREASSANVLGAVLMIAGVVGMSAALPILLVGAIVDDPGVLEGGGWTLALSFGVLIGGFFTFVFTDSGEVNVSLSPL